MMRGPRRPLPAARVSARLALACEDGRAMFNMTPGETFWWPWSGRKSLPRAPAADPGAPAKPADQPPDTKEIEALAASLNRSAERVQTLWLSFLTFTLYLAIAAGTTTHHMLFREDPLTLPVLNIPLPLIGFYVLAPLI